MKAAEMRGKPAYGPEVPNWWLARLVRSTIGWAISRAFRVRLVGAENLPPGGAILAGNHISYLDPVVLWCNAPRSTHFMTKLELWSTVWLGWLLDKFWAFPVNRQGADREAITTATRLLEQGEWVGIFPEGHRRRDGSDELGEAQGGVAFIAMRANVPVVPVGIAGTEEAWPPGRKFPRFVRVVLCFGQPVMPEQFEGGRKERMQAMTAEVMRRIAEEREKAREAR